MGKEPVTKRSIGSVNSSRESIFDSGNYPIDDGLSGSLHTNIYFGSGLNTGFGVDAMRNFLTFGRRTAAPEVEAGGLS